MDRAKLIEEIKRDEGCELKAYRDSLGHWTIGYGRLVDHAREPVPTIMQISRHVAEQWLAQDIGSAIEWVQMLCDDHDVDFYHMSDARQRALVNMCFNLGKTGMSRFKLMWSRIAEEDWEGAAWEMLSLKWAQQVGERAERLAKMMKEG